MSELFEVRHVTVSIAQPPARVYAFVSNVENVPLWASGLASGVERRGGEWVAQSPMGRIKLRFAPANELGVADHDVVMPSGETVHNPMRVVPNGAGSELTFTLFRRPGVSVDEFERDASAVDADLRKLKALLEAH